MSAETFADVLAEIDDPELIAQLHQELDSDQLTPQSRSDQKTLSDLYERLLQRRQNRSPSTIAQYRRTIPRFVGFVENRNVIFPSELTTKEIDAYIDYLFNEYDTDATIQTHTKNVRMWLRWLSKRKLCDDFLYRLLDKEELDLSPKARDEAIPEEEALHLLRRLGKQRRGSAMHALLALLWNGGLRIGGVYSLDIQDFHQECDDLIIRHRHEQGTRLKNGDADDPTPGDGERDITLHPRVVDALVRYMETERHDVTDDHGRQPLFTTKYGRPARSTLRR